MVRYRKGAAIIGIGNLLMKDEGFGVHVIRYLEKNFRFPGEIDLVDAGTAGIYMAPVFEEVAKAIVVDVIALDKEPGSLVHLSYEGMMAKGLSLYMSPHQIGVLEILEVCRFRGTLPGEIDFFCVVPKIIEAGITLSPCVASRVAEISRLVVNDLRQDGYPIENA